MDELVIDGEFRSWIAPLEKAEYNQLETNIIRDGCIEPLSVWNSTILDGHNRYDICTRNNIPYQTVEIKLNTRQDALNWIIDKQTGRRNLAPWQLSLLRGKRYNAVKPETWSRQPVGNQIDTVRTRDKLAKQFQVSPATIQRDGKFAKEAEQASQELETPVMQLSKSQILEVAKKIQEEKRSENRQARIEKLVEISKENKPIQTEKKYNVILADPPWRYEYSQSDIRKIENNYPTMDIDEICELPIKNIASDDCVLFLWTTSPKLTEGIKVLDGWGFQYKTCAVWVKDKIGMGYYFRQQHELLLVGTKGSVPAPEPDKRVSSVIVSDREEHSKKPEIIHKIIEDMYGELPKIELFSRNHRDGWDSWGNQA